jgi:hypothetical protein
MMLFDPEKLNVYELATRFVVLPRNEGATGVATVSRVSMLVRMVHSRNGAGQGTGTGTHRP